VTSSFSGWSSVGVMLAACDVCCNGLTSFDSTCGTDVSLQTYVMSNVFAYVCCQRMRDFNTALDDRVLGLLS
jgi:hypothetical protein